MNLADHQTNLARMMRPQLPQQTVRVAPLDALLGQRVARKIPGVEGHDAVGMARNGHGQHMVVVQVRQQQPPLDGGLFADHRAGKAGLQQRRLNLPLGLRLGSELAQRQHPFAQDTVRPQRLIQPLGRHTEQNFPQDRGKDHAGVQYRLHPPLSRKNSALR